MDGPNSVGDIQVKWPSVASSESGADDDSAGEDAVITGRPRFNNIDGCTDPEFSPETHLLQKKNVSHEQLTNKRSTSFMINGSEQLCTQTSNTCGQSTMPTNLIFNNSSTTS